MRGPCLSFRYFPVKVSILKTTTDREFHDESPELESVLFVFDNKYFVISLG